MSIINSYNLYIYTLHLIYRNHSLYYLELSISIFCKKLHSILWIKIKFWLELKSNIDSNSNFLKNIDSNFFRFKFFKIFRIKFFFRFKFFKKYRFGFEFESKIFFDFIDFRFEYEFESTVLN